MKKISLAIVFALLCPSLLWAQFRISGKISGNDHQPLAGTSIKIKNKSYQTQSSNAGYYELAQLPAGEYWLVVSHLGYETQVQKITLQKNAVLNFSLQQRYYLADEVVVNATRAANKGAFTFTNLNKADIEKVNQGQDLPYLFNQTPSVVVSSDAGAGVGYTGLRIRGSDASRINVTLNGIPFNDPESHATYFVNLPDFASSIDNVQIQRGVGTSTNGAGAFGASLNIQTTTRRDSAYAELNNTVGAFKTLKNTLNVGSGLINGKFSLDGRLSRIKSDGYIDRASADLKSFFVTGAYYGKKDLLRFNIFSGLEKTYQAWNGVEESIMPVNRRHNDYTYDNQVDNYQQDHYQLLYSRNLSSQLLANIALHYTYGRGYYEEFKANKKLADYGMAPLVIGGTTISRTDLVRRRWLDNGFYGFTYSIKYQAQPNLDITLGGAYNGYNGNHFDELIWAKYANYDGSLSIRNRYADDDAFKSDFNIYGRVNYHLNQWSLYVDLQYRNIFYSYLGWDANISPAQQSARLQFFNPKFGLSYALNANSELYTSVAIGNKEPNRRDFTDSSIATRPLSEQLTDWELGYRRRQGKLNLGVNGFAMIYKNQLINTGKLNDVGGFTRQNVPDSYRLGVELDGAWQISKSFTWSATAAFSKNKIKKFTEYIYDNVDNSVLITDYHDVDIAYSPAWVASNDFSYQLQKFSASFLSKYVSKQYFDNRQANQQSLPSYFINDLRLRYQTPVLGLRNLELNFLINNFFDVKYSSSASVYPDKNSGVVDRYNYYFPQATRNYMLSLGLKF